MMGCHPSLPCASPTGAVDAREGRCCGDGKCAVPEVRRGRFRFPERLELHCGPRAGRGNYLQLDRRTAARHADERSDRRISGDGDVLTGQRVSRRHGHLRARGGACDTTRGGRRGNCQLEARRRFRAAKPAGVCFLQALDADRVGARRQWHDPRWIRGHPRRLRHDHRGSKRSRRQPVQRFPCIGQAARAAVPTQRHTRRPW